MIKAIIFDMDGTALDSMGGSSDNVVRYLEHLGIDMSTKEAQSLIKHHWFLTADHINEALGTDYDNKAIYDGYRETHYGMYRNGYQLMPGFLEFLDYLDERGIKYGIATATRINGAEDAMNNHGILDRFSVVTTEGRVGKTKEFPDIYLSAAEEMGATVDETIVFEDALYAIMTASKAGFRTVGIREPYYADDHDAIEKIADVFVTDFNELLELIKAGKYEL